MNINPTSITSSLCLSIPLFFSVFFSIASSLYAQEQETSSQRKALPASLYESLTGKKNIKSQKLLWDQKFATDAYIYGKSPARFLSENVHYIPPHSALLDMGMGEGRNAVFLARKGHKVTGIDISSVAIKKAQRLAKEFGVSIKSIEASLKDYKFKDGEFDGIVCLYYLDRTLLRDMIRWVRPGGVIIFGSYTTSQMNVKNFDMTHYKPEHFLRPQELLTLFPGMVVLKYEEPLHLGEFEGNIILKKPQEK
jgi:SAM-dependent methyltransferase